MKPITSLAPNEVFTFGSNRSGFHGAGAAGFACRGTALNTWRTDPWFQTARRSPVGSPARVGKWAVFGVARGFQVGREGMSYAIETIREAGLKRSTPLSEIQEQFVELFRFANTRSDLTFLLTPVGVGLSGWTAPEMAACLSAAIRQHPVPGNVVIPPDIYSNYRF